MRLTVGQDDTQNYKKAPEKQLFFRGQFYFAIEGQPNFALGGQLRLPSGVKRARLFQAYHLLPESMKENVERNPAVAFAGCNAYYPDLFWRKAKICVEIDGGYHCRRRWYDTIRDSVFEQHGFATIRIKNRDVFVNVAFWQRLLEGLEKLHGDHPGIDQYIKELRQMIDSEIQSWTEIGPGTLTFNDDTVLEQTTRMYNAMKAARRWRKKDES